MIRRMLAVAEKEFRHMKHDRLTLALILGLPAIQLLLYGYALETRVRNIPAVLVNRDAHEAGRLLARRITESSLFSIRRAYRSDREIESALRSGDIRVAIEIPPDYTSNLVYAKDTGICVRMDGADVATSNYLLAAMDALGFEATMEQGRRRVPSLAVVEVDSKVMFNPSGRTAAFLVPGLIAILVQTITALLAALAITNERERGTLEQMMASRIGAEAIIGGKCLAVGCIGLAESCILLLLMRWMFLIPVSGSVLLLAAVVPLLVLAPLGLGLLIAARARNQSQALQLANVVLLPSVLLSGFVLPREFLKFPVDWISNALPSTYLVALTRNIVVRGVSFHEAAQGIVLIAGISVAMAAVGFYCARQSIEER